MAVKTKKKPQLKTNTYWVSEYLEHYEVSNVMMPNMLSGLWTVNDMFEYMLCFCVGSHSVLLDFTFFLSDPHVLLFTELNLLYILKYWF